MAVNVILETGGCAPRLLPCQWALRSYLCPRLRAVSLKYRSDLPRSCAYRHGTDEGKEILVPAHPPLELGASRPQTPFVSQGFRRSSRLARFSRISVPAHPPWELGATPFGSRRQGPFPKRQVLLFPPTRPGNWGCCPQTPCRRTNPSGYPTVGLGEGLLVLARRCDELGFLCSPAHPGARPPDPLLS